MGQKSRWALPLIIHPARYRKFAICVPDERFYIAAFQGLLIELTYSKNWQRDPSHKAAAVSRVWQTALEDVLCDDCGETVLLDELEYIMSVCEQLRFQNGKLQGFCCGEWVDIDGQEDLPPGGGDQPGGGTDQPGPGECVTYHGKMQANNKWYLPTVLNAGDTVSLTNVSGAGNDGTLSPWHCPNGNTFFAGACIGGTRGFDGSDPDSAGYHMEVVLNIAGSWYEPLNGIVTVPGGVLNGEAFIQVNDSNISDNAGSYTFDVEVCNNAGETFTHVFNFELTNGGFVNRTDGSATPNTQGAWVPGSGWESTAAVVVSDTEHVVNIALNLASPVTINTAVLKFNLTKGTIDPGLTDGMYWRLGASNVVTHTEAADSTANGSPKTFSITPGTYSVDNCIIVVYDGWHNPAANGTTLLLELTVTGQGIDPF